jgi:hypothetical protein
VLPFRGVVEGGRGTLVRFKEGEDVGCDFFKILTSDVEETIYSTLFVSVTGKRRTLTA